VNDYWSCVVEGCGWTYEGPGGWFWSAAHERETTHLTRGEVGE
jgi:hypothetical protein